MKKVVITLAMVLLSSVFVGTVFGTTGIVNTDDVNLRDGANTTGTNVLVKMNKNANLEIVEEQGDWYKVNYNTYSGYVNKKYIDKKEENSTNPANTIDTTNTTGAESNIENTNSDGSEVKEDAIVYVLPLINSSKISEVEKGEKVTIISEVGNWKYIQTSYISGWILANKIDGSLENNSNLENNQIDEENIVNTTITNDIETTNNENVINETTENTTTSENTSNSNTENEENTINESNTSTTYPITLYVNVDAVNIRESPNTSSEINDSAEKNAAVKVTGESGDWYKVEVNGVKGYVLKQYLSKNKV